VVDLPGWVPHAPFAQEVFRLRRSPLELRMEGEATEAAGAGDPFRRPRLAVRARDGSSFWFESFGLHFALDPARAVEVLLGLGGDPRRWAELVFAHASAILRDEFGRHGAEEIVVPEVLEQAAKRCEERLGAALARHGLRLVGLSAPEPGFDRDWERAVERRKVHDQQVAYLAARLEELGEVRGRRLAETRKELGLARHEWEARLGLEILQAERELFVARSEAEREHERIVAEARAALEARRAEIEGLAARESAEVDALAAEIDALERAGEAAVRQALVERLGLTSFVLEPYARDAEPERVEGERR
jgi:hypothetical protein